MESTGTYDHCVHREMETLILDYMNIHAAMGPYIENDLQQCEGAGYSGGQLASLGTADTAVERAQNQEIISSKQLGDAAKKCLSTLTKMDKTAALQRARHARAQKARDAARSVYTDLRAKMLSRHPADWLAEFEPKKVKQGDIARGSAAPPSPARDPDESIVEPEMVDDATPTASCPHSEAAARIVGPRRPSQAQGRQYDNNLEPTHANGKKRLFCD
ncbi:unnamed protein product, partial [Mesorhabditis spiculigera]